MSNKPPSQPPSPIDYRLSKLIAAFGFAFEGLWHVLRSQRNAQIHLLIGACAVALGAVLGLARWEWLILVLTITLVLTLETVNTALEAAVDAAIPEYHPLVKIAKDTAAGAVLIAAIGAVVVGCLLFIPHLWALLPHLE